MTNTSGWANASSGSLPFLSSSCRDRRVSDRRSHSKIQNWRASFVRRNIGSQLSFQGLGVEGSNGVVFHFAGNFNGVAAHFTIFHIRLTGNRQVHDHRNLFPAIRANEKVFHLESAFGLYSGGLQVADAPKRFGDGA